MGFGAGRLATRGAPRGARPDGRQDAGAAFRQALRDGWTLDELRTSIDLQRILGASLADSIAARPPSQYRELASEVQALRLCFLQFVGMVTRRLDELEASIAHTFDEGTTRCDSLEVRLRELEKARSA